MGISREVVNNPAKAGLMRDISPDERSNPLREEPAKYQLVGSVIDYQGYDA